MESKRKDRFVSHSGVLIHGNYFPYTGGIIRPPLEDKEIEDRNFMQESCDYVLCPYSAIPPYYPKSGKHLKSLKRAFDNLDMDIKFFIKTYRRNICVDSSKPISLSHVLDGPYLYIDEELEIWAEKIVMKKYGISKKEFKNILSAKNERI